jgi:hypothetical protein
MCIAAVLERRTPASLELNNAQLPSALRRSIPYPIDGCAAASLLAVGRHEGLHGTADYVFDPRQRWRRGKVEEQRLEQRGVARIHKLCRRDFAVGNIQAASGDWPRDIHASSRCRRPGRLRRTCDRCSAFGRRWRSPHVSMNAGLDRRASARTRRPPG